MSQEFIKLEQDDDLVMLGKDIFTVARLKELLSENIKQTFDQTSRGNSSIVSGFYSRELSLTDKSIRLNLSNFALVFPSDGLECQVFNFNSKEWINIKLRVIADFQIGQFNDFEDSWIKKLKVDLEYSYPDNALRKDDNTDQSLDDLRAKLNQINPS